MLGDGPAPHPEQDQRPRPGLGHRHHQHPAARAVGQHLEGPGLAALEPTGVAVLEDGTIVAIAEGDARSRAVATYLACVTTFHTADHHSFANIALEKMPWRIRKPFPQEGSAPAYDLDTLVTPEDSFRARLAHSMFFRPAVITSLRDITYNFSHPDERAAALRWQATMSALDAQWQGSGFPRADEIASGVHY